MGHETVYSSGLTEAEIRQWERNFRAYFGLPRESPEELERSWQEGPGKNPPLPPLRQRFGISGDDNRVYLFLSSRPENSFFSGEGNLRSHFSRAVALCPEMTGRDVVRALLGKKSPDLKAFAFVCVGGNAEETFSAGGYSVNLPVYLEDAMGIKLDQKISETGLRFALS
ncbi:MAG: hypothetical protein H6862_04410 [Rhodospirillales bacterium]|nr:hypothetical protein [Rhodospirillales bacterium]